MTTGHVFVVQGRIENLDCDAIVIPTDDVFRVEPHWAPALGAPASATGETWYRTLRDAAPEAWHSSRWGRLTPGALPWEPPRPVWFVDAASYSARRLAAERDLRALASRLAAIVDDVAAAGLPASHGRPHPLIAVPTLGVGGGGFGPLRGMVIDEVLTTALAVVATNPVDVVFVALLEADYAAFQDRRRSLVGHPKLPGEAADALGSLIGKASAGTLAVFIGAGVSMSVGLPSWEELLDQLAGDDESHHDLSSPLDRAQLLRHRLGTGLGDRVAEIVGKQQRYGLTHALLAGLGASHAVTTNYDHLYELALADRLSGGRPLHVLPYDKDEPHRPWLVKMHGDVEHPGEVVLARSDFVGYTSRSGPLGAVVQSLLMTEHLLVVGASLSDDNFLRLAHEVLAFRRGHHRLGTVLKFTVTAAERELWAEAFDFVAVASPSDEPGAAARRLAIVLDTLAMRAARPVYVLDERYDDLLSAAARPGATAARSLGAAIASLPEADGDRWSNIATALRDHGLPG